ncbi:MAG TPA: MFS transporter, partial [Acidocella sp.]|nr:MFS transporter [Acidocella sp.]
MTPAFHKSQPAIVSVLGITQTLAWGSTYYLPAVLADPICRSLHVSDSWFFAIFSGSLLLSGLLGPMAGRLIDQRGGRDVLAATNLAFALGLGLLSMASGLTGLALAWAVIGLGMGFGLYEAAFATATGLFRAKARGAITGITLFAGFASTVGWPASALFSHEFGWRGACLAWAALHLLVGLPLNRFLVPKAAPATSEAEAPSPPVGGVSRTMAILAGVFAAGWFISVAMASNLPRLLEALGATPALAVGAAALMGPAQVGARLIEFSLLRHVSPLVSARLAMALHPIGAGLLLLIGPAATILFTILHGGGNGLQTIARGTLPLALFGAKGYGLRTGLLAAPGRILQGGAPLLFSLVLDHGGPYDALYLSSTLGILAFGALAFVRTPQKAQTKKAAAF